MTGLLAEVVRQGRDEARALTAGIALVAAVLSRARQHGTAVA